MANVLFHMTILLGLVQRNWAGESVRGEKGVDNLGYGKRGLSGKRVACVDGRVLW